MQTKNSLIRYLQNKHFIAVIEFKTHTDILIDTELTPDELEDVNLICNGVYTVFLKNIKGAQILELIYILN